MIIDTLRPVSVYQAGTATAVPSGTLASVTADDSDATYASQPVASTTTWLVTVASHTPASGYQRHQLRSRVRARGDAGTAAILIFAGRQIGGGYSAITEPASITSSFADLSGSWSPSSLFTLDTGGALSGLVVGGEETTDVTGGMTAVQTAECYVDIDTRFHPDFTPGVLDAAGTDQSGGTVSDTTQPDLFFGAVAYDGLPPLDWQVTLSGPDAYTAVFSGSGAPPTQVPVTDNLADGDYEAVFTVRSTIRDGDGFSWTLSVEFEIQNIVAPPSPPLLAVQRVYDGYELSWSFPGGLEWNDDYVIAEVWRDDCTGSQRIATVPDGLNGTYLDLAIPQLDPQPVGPSCDDEASDCDITYRVRYWGYVSGEVEIPDTIPVDLILGWPGSVGSIPSGWTRVTALDGFHPRGAELAGAPSATGGATSHTHTTMSHTHQIGTHQHTVGGSTAGSNTSTTTNRFNGADRSVANQSHNHTFPSATGARGQNTTGATAPGTNSSSNEPPTREVIWVHSDGTQTAFPIGILGFSAETISAWTADSSSTGRFLRGAVAAGAGGASYGSPTHTHTVNSHNHSIPAHDHSIASTGLSGPAATSEGETGGTNPRWLPRHTHPLNSIAGGSGTTSSNSGGTTGSATLEPAHRRLRVLRNTGGGLQTRIIGLATIAAGSLPSALTWCNGGSGTPDMRNQFCRDVGTGSVNSTGGASTHTHSTPSHSHTAPAHRHDITVGESNTTDYARKTSGDQGNVPTATHTHQDGETANSTPAIGGGGGGTSGSSSHVPPYKEVHFVRLDGVFAGGTLPVPELRTSEFAEITVSGFTYDDGLDRLSSTTTRIAVATDRSHGHPRISVSSVPIEGGLPSVATTIPGEDVTLTIAAEGKPAIDELEELLAADHLYYAPVGGTPGWFAPSGWTTGAPAPNVKVVTVTMARIDWPAALDPEELL